MTPTCRRIADHVLRLGLAQDVPADLRVERTRAGRWQRSCGAFSWFLRSDSDPYHHVNCVGSVYPARVVARCAHVEGDQCHTDVVLWPCGVCAGRAK